VSYELSYSRRFRNRWTVKGGPTGRFHTASKLVRGLDPGRRVHWRPLVRRHATTTIGPARSFRVLPPRPAPKPLRIAIASCGSQFGPIFGRLAEIEPDVFVWQGDLNYPDTHGPLAQTTSGYAGIWRDFLANPALAPILERSAFATQRDDHDYGLQDANSTNVGDYPWGLAPWQALMNRRAFYRFRAGAAEVWVLDQRLHKSDPELPDGPGKTLLGARQRRWLMRTLAASRARFKLICSPTTLFMPANARDGNWATSFTAERDLLLGHIEARVSGTTIFLTGDTHLTGVYDADGRFEARAAPIGIPKPNDITLLDPTAAETLRRRSGVVYAGDDNHATVIEIRGRSLELRLMREDGAIPFERRFGR
jgi:phosphodiesterase/alkaline phosphatase D-like protein